MSLGIDKEKGSREKLGDAGLGDGSIFGREENDGVGCAEFVDGLAAGSTGLAGGFVEVGDGDGADTDFRSVEADGAGDGGLFCANGEAVGGVFDIAAGDDSTVDEQGSGADAEVAVGGVGVMSDGDGALLQVGSHNGIEDRGELGGLVVARRHDVSEAIDCKKR